MDYFVLDETPVHTDKGWCVVIYSLFTMDEMHRVYENRDSDYLHTAKLKVDAMNRK